LTWQGCNISVNLRGFPNKSLRFLAFYLEMKKVTAAVVMIDNDGNILGCHGTGKPKDYGFDFPKGEVEKGEEDIDAAIRELREETSFILSKDSLIDIGVYPHNNKKDIHLFLCKMKELPNPQHLKCDSFFEVNGKQIPEVDFYEIISKENRKKFNMVLQNKFEIIDEKLVN